MKTSTIVFLIFCGGVAGAIIFLNREKTPPTPAPVGASSPSQPAMPAPPEKIVAANSESPQTNPKNANETPQVSAAMLATSETQPDDSTNSIHKLVDALLSAKSAAQKQALFDQLRKSNQLDQAIAELKQRATDNPNDAEIPTTLGEAQLNELRAMKEAGSDDYSAIGILAMQADQSFTAALKIDPQNWEAQFVKNASMYYWPANPQMDNAVVQNLSKLVDQQDTMTPQPEFAQTYIVLGNEYQKIGQPDKAQATWQLGLTKFPNDSTLQKKISGQ